VTAVQSSIDTYHAHLSEGGAQTQLAKIVEFLASGRMATRREISEATGIEPGAVAGRVNWLVNHGVLIEAVGRHECSVTHRRVKAVRLAPGQLDLFKAGLIHE
jgi:predicted transcriptional regulator